MFSWFTRFLEALGVLSSGLDQVSTTLDKAAEPAAKVEEIRRKADKVGDQYRELGR